MTNTLILVDMRLYLYEKMYNDKNNIPTVYGETCALTSTTTLNVRTRRQLFLKMLRRDVSGGKQDFVFCSYRLSALPSTDPDVVRNTRSETIHNAFLNYYVFFFFYWKLRIKVGAHFLFISVNNSMNYELDSVHCDYAIILYERFLFTYLKKK